MFKGFDKRLQRDIKRTVDKRIQASEELSGGHMRVHVQKGSFVHIELTIYSLS